MSEPTPTPVLPPPREILRYLNRGEITADRDEGLLIGDGTVEWKRVFAPGHPKDSGIFRRRELVYYPADVEAMVEGKDKEIADWTESYRLQSEDRAFILTEKQKAEATRNRAWSILTGWDERRLTNKSHQDADDPNAALLDAAKRNKEALEKAEADLAAANARIAELENAVQYGWVVIANVSGGDWMKQSEEWRKEALQDTIRQVVALAEAVEQLWEKTK